MFSPPRSWRELWAEKFLDRMFNQQEVQILLGGVNTPIDIQDLKNNTNYGGLYGASHPVILMFWKVRPFIHPSLFLTHRIKLINVGRELIHRRSKTSFTTIRVEL